MHPFYILLQKYYIQVLHPIRISIQRREILHKPFTGILEKSEDHYYLAATTIELRSSFIKTMAPKINPEWTEEVNNAISGLKGDMESRMTKLEEQLMGFIAKMDTYMGKRAE